jgi:hypothetical protein
MAIRFHDPRAEDGLPAEPYELSLTGRERPVFGFIANGFPDSPRLAAELERELRRIIPTGEARHFVKESVAHVVQGAMLEQVVEECDAVVGLYGQ